MNETCRYCGHEGHLMLTECIFQMAERLAKVEAHASEVGKALSNAYATGELSQQWVSVEEKPSTPLASAEGRPVKHWCGAKSPAGTECTIDARLKHDTHKDHAEFYWPEAAKDAPAPQPEAPAGFKGHVVIKASDILEPLPAEPSSDAGQAIPCSACGLPRLIPEGDIPLAMCDPCWRQRHPHPFTAPAPSEPAKAPLSERMRGSPFSDVRGLADEVADLEAKLAEVEKERDAFALDLHEEQLAHTEAVKKAEQAERVDAEMHEAVLAERARCIYWRGNVAAMRAGTAAPEERDAGIASGAPAPGGGT